MKGICVYVCVWAALVHCVGTLTYPGFPHLVLPSLNCILWERLGNRLLPVTPDDVTSAVLIYTLAWFHRPPQLPPPPAWPSWAWPWSSTRSSSVGHTYLFTWAVLCYLRSCLRKSQVLLSAGHRAGHCPALEDKEQRQQ